MSKLIAVCALAAMLSACETCREHRVACAVAAVVVTGAVAAYAEKRANHINLNDHDADEGYPTWTLRAIP